MKKTKTVFENIRVGTDLYCEKTDKVPTWRVLEIDHDLGLVGEMMMLHNGEETDRRTTGAPYDKTVVLGFAQEMSNPFTTWKNRYE